MRHLYEGNRLAQKCRNTYARVMGVCIVAAALISVVPFLFACKMEPVSKADEEEVFPTLPASLQMGKDETGIVLSDATGTVFVNVSEICAYENSGLKLRLNIYRTQGDMTAQKITFCCDDPEWDTISVGGSEPYPLSFASGSACVIVQTIPHEVFVVTGDMQDDAVQAENELSAAHLSLVFTGTSDPNTRLPVSGDLQFDPQTFEIFQ